MAKCESPYSKKAQGVLDLFKKRKETEVEVEAQVTATLEQLDLENAEKRKRHKPLDQYPPGTISDQFVAKVVKDYGRMPDGICIKERQLPELERLVETCFTELHQIKDCYATTLLPTVFARHTSPAEIPVIRFLLSDFVTVEPDLDAGPARGYVTEAQEKEILRQLSSDQLGTIKAAFRAAAPRTAEDARNATCAQLVPPAWPKPMTLQDGVDGLIVTLGGGIFDNARVLHTKLLVKWMVKHMIFALSKRPEPDAVIEYCLQYSKVRAQGFWIYMRWCTRADGMTRYGIEPEPCLKFNYPIYD